MNQSQAVWAFQIAYNRLCPGTKLKENGTCDVRTRAAIVADVTPSDARLAFQRSWNQTCQPKLAENGKISASLVAVVSGLCAQNAQSASMGAAPPAVQPSVNPQTMFIRLAPVLRKLIPSSGRPGYDIAVACGFGTLSDSEAAGALSRMTKAQAAGFASGVALKKGLEHPEFHRALQNFTSHASRGSQTSMGEAINLYPGVTFTPDQIAAMMAQYAAHPPTGPAKAMADASMAIATGKAPTSPAEAAAQQTVALLLTGNAVGAGSPFLGPGLTFALGSGAMNAALAPVMAHPVAAAGAVATPTAAASVAASGHLNPFSRLVNWIKAHLLPHPAAASPLG